MRIVIIGAIVALVLVPVGAWAQTTGTGAFAQLPPGEQKIARALFEAQSASAPTQQLTLGEIAAKKQGRQGWGEVFKQMKTQGLLTQKNLGQVVSSFERRHPEAAGATGGRGNGAGDMKAGGSSHGENATGASASGNGSGRGAGHGGRR